MEFDLYGALAPLCPSVVWGGFDQGAGFPRITLQRISNRTEYALKSRAGNETARVQVNVYATSYEDMLALAELVSRTLTDFRGGSVIRCKEISRRDSTSETDGDVVRLQMLDFTVRYRA